MSKPVGQQVNFGNELIITNLNILNDYYMPSIEEIIDDNEPNIFDYESEEEDWD